VIFLVVERWAIARVEAVWLGSRDDGDFADAAAADLSSDGARRTAPDAGMVAAEEEEEDMGRLVSEDSAGWWRGWKQRQSGRGTGAAVAAVKDPFAAAAAAAAEGSGDSTAAAAVVAVAVAVAHWDLGEVEIGRQCTMDRAATTRRRTTTCYRITHMCDTDGQQQWLRCNRGAVPLSGWWCCWLVGAQVWVVVVVVVRYKSVSN
jgi:hypothetical protein